MTAVKSIDTSGSPRLIGTPELVKSAKSDGEEVDLGEVDCGPVRLKPKAAGDGWCRLQDIGINDSILTED
jgi:hypothetical protein